MMRYLVPKVRQRTPTIQLPPEIWLLVFAYCDRDTIKELQYTCKAFRALVLRSVLARFGTGRLPRIHQLYLKPHAHDCYRAHGNDIQQFNGDAGYVCIVSFVPLTEAQGGYVHPNHGSTHVSVWSDVHACCVYDTVYHGARPDIQSETYYVAIVQSHPGTPVAITVVSFADRLRPRLYKYKLDTAKTAKLGALLSQDGSLLYNTTKRVVIDGNHQNKKSAVWTSATSGCTNDECFRWTKDYVLDGHRCVVHRDAAIQQTEYQDSRHAPDHCRAESTRYHLWVRLHNYRGHLGHAIQAVRQ
jgi:hypothetical protein